MYYTEVSNYTGKLFLLDTVQAQMDVTINLILSDIAFILAEVAAQ